MEPKKTSSGIKTTQLDINLDFKASVENLVTNSTFKEDEAAISTICRFASQVEGG
jgi:hypothetical protein